MTTHQCINKQDDENWLYLIISVQENMASEAHKPHFVLFPLMAPGHMNPMMDIAKILVHSNVIVTVVTTPHNAARFTSVFDRYFESGFRIRLAQLEFPCKEGGVPDGCENLDMIPSLGMAAAFFKATTLLQQPAEKLFEELTPPPCCIISDMCLPYTIHIAKRHNIPRISFVGASCFCLLCLHNIRIYNVEDSLTSESEYFVLPGIPDKIEMTIAQAAQPINETWKKFRSEIMAAEMASYGIIMNSFEELEPAYARDYKKVRGEKVWCIGPVSLVNKDHLDKAQRGRGSIDVSPHVKWLDCQKPGSVIYACLGSLCNLTPPQLIELGLALEASERPFIWVIREGSHSEGLEKWINEYGFEERTNGRSLLIRGWAPQLLILSHPAIGGFITHCGWNSTLEAICSGVPMVTWPLFADQFLNESLVVHVLKVGVTVGAKSPVTWGKEEEIGVMVKKEDVERAIMELMDETSESEERRKRVREFADKAKRAVEKGGSSHSNVNLLIQDIMKKNHD
ncbi:UDP-glycosyltransferase 73C6 [Cajanus cajan]|uniref:UDP-glycosyltransferase 73C6 n=1 Tax=Cajanus cajan TaxID=3821 RepID=UPI00098DB802|nr:UDP-glycosyltransferase 73C6 [Cajanus cajan]